jgi:hypothetical protein
MWALVWLQLTSGMPLEYFQISSYENRSICEQVKKRASIMITDTSIAIACLNIKVAEE